MTLQTFISESLTQITAGVTAARESAPEVAPTVRFDDKSPAAHQTEDGDPVFLVDFDVAVSATERTESGAEGGAGLISVFSAKGRKADTSEHSEVSRLRFSVPITYP